jgi:oligopeptide/dipeptide ABC transporter ATP-binding protein
LPEPLLSIRNLRTYFYTYAGVVRALEGIDLDVHKGETIGLVGETGCGKSVTSLSIMRLVANPPGKIVDGKIVFKGEDLLHKSEEEMRKIRGDEITMVFQDPMTYLNPVMTLGDQIAEVITLHQDLAKEYVKYRVAELKKRYSEAESEGLDSAPIKGQLSRMETMLGTPPKLSRRQLKEIAIQRAIDVLRLVRMPYPEKVVKQYPHELSGGMRQRAMIAMALSCNPDLLIADEPTTALDATIQAQLLALLNELKKEVGASVMIITHDLGIVAETCERVVVMYAGQIAEVSQTKDLFRRPLHPYTQGLLRAVPKLHVEVEELEIIPGSVPNLIYPPSGCRFHPRCPFAMERCRAESPPMYEVGREHQVACYLYAPSAG